MLKQSLAARARVDLAAIWLPRVGTTRLVGAWLVGVDHRLDAREAASTCEMSYAGHPTPTFASARNQDAELVSPDGQKE